VALLIGGTLAYLYLPFPWSLVTILALAAFEGLEIWFWLWLRRQRPRAGHESLVGERADLVAPSRVRLRGTTYPARVADDASPGDEVVVEAVEGMTLAVRRAPEREWRA
jgi:membrane protein implicated in regulation of membrane protease activity